jgi:hypothetical protein
MQMASAGIAPSDGSDYAAGVLSVVSGTATNEIQTVSILGYSRSKSTSVATNGAGDACGVYGVGRVTDSGIGIGMGAFFDGRRDTNTGRAAAVQLSCDNNTASAGTYNSIGYSDTLGIWLVPAGTSNSGVGFQIGNPFGVQFDVGIGFNGQVSGGKTGGITTSSIRDDSTSIVSIDIRGTHSGGAIKIADGSGGIAIGGSLTTGRKIDVQGTITGATSIVVINAAGTVASDVTSNVSLVSSTLSTAASSFTLTTVQHHAANQGTVGAGSAITNQYGFIANSSLTGAANNYGFFGNIAAGSGRWNLNMTGTAQNFLSGVTGIGIAASSTAQLALAAGTTGVSSLRVPHGSAPTSPVNGDMWTTTSGLYVQVNGSTVGPLS